MKYKHIKTGNIYELLYVANQCDTEKFPKTAVYLSIDTREIFARPFIDFNLAFEVVDK